jgi:Peptidase family M28
MLRKIPAGLILLLWAMIVPASRAGEPASEPGPLTPDVRASLDRISADSLRGHLSFLASDLLEGRGTPSRGLDLAAEYIAAQFRRAGLEPIGDDGYFQTADWKYLAPDPEGFHCEFKGDGRSIAVAMDHASGSLGAAVDLPPTAVVKVDASDAQALKALRADQLKGKVVLAKLPNPYKVDRSRMREANRARLTFFDRVEELKPALIVDVDHDTEAVLGLRRDVGGRRSGRSRAGTPTITLHSPQLARAFDAMPAGPSGATLSLHVGEPKERTTSVRNVVGLLRGSDPALKETYVLLTAHYDHLGIGPANGSGDRIFNGANDDGSGTVSVIEIASALATLKPRTKRSLIFATFYGEEHGLVGSRHYVEHPVVPLEKTVADINLEQVGRTDDSDGPRVSAATVTGYDYSDVGSLLHRAGRAVGVDVLKHPTKSDSYFGASDNAAFARAGIPAHTISVAYMFPDSHGADDEWEKVDFANMAKVDRMAALGLILIADGPAPAWNQDNPKAAAYRKRTAKPD